MKIDSWIQTYKKRKSIRLLRFYLEITILKTIIL